MFYPIFTLFILLFILIFYIIFIWDTLIANLNVKYIDVPSSKKACRNVQSVINESGKKNGVFYDLGSGRGRLAILTKKAFPEMKVYGFDRSGFKIIFSKARAYISGSKVIFKRMDIFKTDLSKADIIYIYTWSTTIEKLKEKLEKETKKDTLIISSTFPIPGWKPILTKETLTIKKDPLFEKIYVYKKF